MTVLNLSHNFLANMSYVPFRTFQQGSIIYLNNNNFTTISSILFPSNSIIDLSDNNIYFIAADMHSNWGSLSSLLMSGNPSVCSVQYNLIPAVFPCFNATGGNASCSQVFCKCDKGYVGMDVCVPETDAYLQLPLLLSAYSNVSVGSVAHGFSVVSGLDAFVHYSNVSQNMVEQNVGGILKGNPVLSYFVSNITKINASFSIPWTMSVFQLHVDNSQSYQQCIQLGSCLHRLPRYIVGILPSVALSSSINNTISKSVTAKMNPAVPTNVSFLFSNPQCQLPGGAQCPNYSLVSVLPNYIYSILANSSGSSLGYLNGSSTLQLSGFFSYSTKFSVDVVACESNSNESYLIANLTVDITDCPPASTSTSADSVCSQHG